MTKIRLLLLLLVVLAPFFSPSAGVAAASNNDEEDEASRYDYPARKRRDRVLSLFEQRVLAPEKESASDNFRNEEPTSSLVEPYQQKDEVLIADEDVKHHSEATPPLTKNSTLEKVLLDDATTNSSDTATDEDKAAASLPDATTNSSDTATDQDKAAASSTNSSSAGVGVTTSGKKDDEDDGDDSKSDSKKSKKTPSPSASPAPTSESSKKSKSSKDSSPTSSPAPTSESKKSKSSKSSKDDDSPTSSPAPTSSDSKKSSKSSKSSKGSKKGSQTYQGKYVRLRDYRKSCSSNAGCIKDLNAFCMGGMDVVQEFEVEDLGTVAIHLDIAWDFAKAPSTCGTVSTKEETLLGIGWLPITLANSYVCYSEYVYRIPESPNLNNQTFAGRFQVELPDGEKLEGQILSGAVCELFSPDDDNVYLKMNSFAILAMIPGYSVSLQYQLDERDMEVMEVLSGAPHITMMEDDSYNSGRWDHLLPVTASILQGK